MDQVLEYISQGLTPCPVGPLSKKPAYDDWQNTDASRAAELFEANPDFNIGIVLGDRSNGIVDVDLDAPGCVAIGPHLLPATEVRFGRASKRNSHFIYKVQQAQKTKQFRHPETRAMLVELRGNGSQTVFPPSIHLEGEEIEFEGDPGEVGETDWETLQRCCALIAVGALVLERFNEGSRHKLALSLAGLLACCGISRDDARRVVAAVTSAAGDPEAEDRLEAVETTYDRADAGQPVEYLTSLGEQLGAKTVEAMRKWLGGKQEVAVVRHNTTVGSFEELTTDVGAATAFSKAVEGRLLFADGLKQWFVSEDDVFGQVSHEYVNGLAIEFITASISRATSVSHFPQMRALLSAGRVRAMIELAKPMLRTDHGRFDEDPYLVGCRGGVLNLTQRELVSPESTVTRRITTSYDPDAECPNFRAFLQTIFDGDDEKIRFVQRAVGYSLTGLTSGQCLFVLTGSGANGKSTLTGVLHHLLGDYATSTPTHTLMVSRYGNERTDDLAVLRGMRFVSAQEGEVGERLAEAKIKLMTGGDTISCRKLYGQYETYRPQFKLWVATNELPNITGTGDAIWRRIHVVEFPVTIPPDQRDPKLREKLVAELPGILNWALDGLEAWEEVGLSPPASVTQATGAYRSESDTVGQFVDVCCERDPDATTTVQDLHGAYTAWCECGGVEAMASPSFGKELSRLGFEVQKSKAGNKRRGLRLIGATSGSGKQGIRALFGD